MCCASSWRRSVRISTPFVPSEPRQALGERHLKLQLGKHGRRFPAILFNCIAVLPATIRAVYRLEANEYKGNRSLQLVLRHWE